MRRLTELLARAARDEDRAGFVASRLLWASRLCRLITFELPDGYRMRFYPSSASTAFWQNRHFRPADAALLRSYLRPGDTFVDVGANVGYLSLLAWTRVRPTGRVVAIEAHPRTAGFLAGNVRLNRFPIETHNVAIGERPGSVWFTSLRSDDQNHAVPAVAGPGRVRVAVTTLDQLLGPTHVDLLKIDTEGFEVNVLAGAAATLERCAAIYIEDSDRNLRRYGRCSAELRQALADTGFLAFRIVDGRAVPVAAVPAGGRSTHNLFAVRREAHEALLGRASLTRAG